MAFVAISRSVSIDADEHLPQRRLQGVLLQVGASKSSDDMAAFITDGTTDLDLTILLDKAGMFQVEEDHFAIVHVLPLQIDQQGEYPNSHPNTNH